MEQNNVFFEVFSCTILPEPQLQGGSLEMYCFELLGKIINDQSTVGDPAKFRE